MALHIFGFCGVRNVWQVEILVINKMGRLAIKKNCYSILVLHKQKVTKLRSPSLHFP